MAEVIDRQQARYSSIITRIKNNLSHMVSMRSNYDSIYKDIIKYVHPYRGDFIQSFVPGRRRVNDIFDSTAPFAAQEFASALGSFLTDPSTRWANIETFNPNLNRDRSVRQYFDDVMMVLYDMIFSSPHTNFQDSLNEMYLDIATFGTSVLFVEDRIGKPPVFRSFHLGGCHIRENEQGRVDTVYREFKMTYRQLRERWPDETLALVEKYDKTPNKSFDILHTVEPADGLEPIPGLFPFTSVYVILNESLILNEGGFSEFPYVVPRWRKVAHEVYGRSQTMMAMPHIKMVNAMAKTVIKAGQKATSPPLQAPDDGFMLPLDMSPDAINYYRAGNPDRIEPIRSDSRPDIGLELIEAERQQIERIYFLDVLRLKENGPEMREVEVLRRTEDRMRSMSPMMGRVQAEATTPIVTRTYNIAERRGMLPPLPPILQGQPFRLRYVSPMATAQKASQLNNMSRAMEFLTLVFNLKPETADRIDADGMIDIVHDLLDTPEKMLVPLEQAIEERAARQEQQQQILDSDQAVNQSQALKNLTPLLTQ